MDDQNTAAGFLPAEEPQSPRKPRRSEPAPVVDPLGAALAAWAGKYDPADTATALHHELAARGITTIDLFMGTAPAVILAALNAALRRDVVSLVNAVAQVKKEE